MTSFVGGSRGRWEVQRIGSVLGASLSSVERLAVVEGHDETADGASWLLRGSTSSERYVRAAEQVQLKTRSPQIGRPEATRAALIPIRKSEAWWTLAQDERREIFEERSRHISTGLEYLPDVARRLYHCRDLGEPFDFLTWFEYAPTASTAFEELVHRLRETEEWRYVEREVDIRMVRDDRPTARAGRHTRE